MTPLIIVTVVVVGNWIRILLPRHWRTASNAVQDVIFYCICTADATCTKLGSTAFASPFFNFTDGFITSISKLSFLIISPQLKLCNLFRNKEQFHKSSYTYHARTMWTALAADGGEVLGFRKQCNDTEGCKCISVLVVRFLVGISSCGRDLTYVTFFTGIRSYVTLRPSFQPL